ncbi:sensor histidine kinase [Cognaticolwellia mytili]|uniref:sensor histidine kinase n=1 Tax=Cognaticolwellia mytili TaxID=1888913 RepID=UPI000A17445B|nr:ATP-binding protein [Cognaticolwellia mytili]
MRRLYISIILTVIGSLFIITWGLDKIVAKQEPIQAQSEYAIYHQLIEGFDRQLSSQPLDNLTLFSLQLSQTYQIGLQLDKSKNIALPAELNTQLSQKGGLLLASETQPYLLKQLTSYPAYVIQLSLPIMEIEDHKINMILTATLYLGVCIILLAWLFPLTRRLYLLTNMATQIGTGNLTARMPLSRFSYISLLENSFNRMATQIEKLVADNKILARSMSHDIRTPMSCLRFGVEAALDTENIDKKNQYLNRMEAELTRMEDMTTAFLEYAGMERQGFRLKRQLVNINDFLNTINSDFQSLAEQHDVKLTYQASAECIKQPTSLSLDFHWCYRAIQNLLGNAVQYAQNKVTITSYQKNNYLYITVEDDGKGIPEESIESIFDPFVKLDVDRSRELGHFGLGLAITAKVIHWHNGSIRAKNNIRDKPNSSSSNQLKNKTIKTLQPTVTSGACFIISLPLSLQEK